jgi:hypothetical protein
MLLAYFRKPGESSEREAKNLPLNTWAQTNIEKEGFWLPVQKIEKTEG